LCKLPPGRIYSTRAQKSKFIIATNELDSQKLSDREVLMGYKGQAKVERGFRFLKDPQFVASSFFVKKPERVEALLFIMTLCLTLYAALEYKLRQKLEQEQESLPNQLGKPVRNPTTRWVFALFAGIHFLYGAQNQPICLNLNSIHTKVLDLLGQPYKKYYWRL
jgi:transposase